MVDALAALPEREATEIAETLRLIPAAFGRPHTHAGLGIRQLRPGVYEARLGLHRRAIFSRDNAGLVVDFIGTHDEVRRYLRSL